MLLTIWDTADEIGFRLPAKEKSRLANVAIGKAAMIVFKLHKRLALLDWNIGAGVGLERKARIDVIGHGV